jgi:hypothetical protein
LDHLAHPAGLELDFLADQGFEPEKAGSEEGNTDDRGTAGHAVGGAGHSSVGSGLGRRVTGLKPTWDKLSETDEIRVVEVIDSGYSGFGPGAFIEDWKMSWGAIFRHHSAFKRIAVVTDKEWIAHTVHALAWMVPGEIKMFALDDLDRAAQWAASN